MQFEILTIAPESDMVSVHALVKSQATGEQFSVGIYMQTTCTELLSMDHGSQEAWVAAELTKRLRQQSAAFVS